MVKSERQHQKGIWKCLCLFAFGVFCLIFSNLHTILPNMEYDEYFEECRSLKDVPDFKRIIIHNNGCPKRGVPWLTLKHSKYDIMIKKDMKFCNECFDRDEIKLLIQIHEYNIKELKHAYLYQGKYSKEKLDSALYKYKRQPQIKNVYDEW